MAPFTIVADEVTGPSDGQKVILRVALGEPTKRDEIYPVLHTLYRHAMKRGPFEPIHFIADVYPSEATAKAAGDTQMLARISRAAVPAGAPSVTTGSATTSPSRSSGPSTPAWAGARGEHRRHLPAGPAEGEAAVRRRLQAQAQLQARRRASKAVEVTYPYLEMGKDEYVARAEADLGAGRTGSSIVTTPVSQGARPESGHLHGPARGRRGPAHRLTRQQFDSDFAGLQETIAAHAAVTFQSLGTGAHRQGRREGAGDLQAEDLQRRAGRAAQDPGHDRQGPADGKMGKSPAAEKPAGGKAKKARRS